MDVEKNTKGRPRLYDPKFCKQVYRLSLLGATKQEIAEFFEVDVDTIYRWQKDFPDFYDSIKRGGIDADAHVSKRTYELALGYMYKETKTELSNDGLSEVVTVTERYLPPSVAAQNIWLKNRRAHVNPKEGLRWADKQEIAIEGKIETDFSKLSTEELLKRAEAIKRLTGE